MDMNKIIEKMKNNRDDKVRESYTCKRGKYSYANMSVLADGYSMAVKDLIDMVEQQTPPCSGSSVKNKDIRAGDYVETISGKVGYVYNIFYSNGNRCISVQLMNGDSCHYNQLLNEEYEYSKHFNRIGQYNFTKQDKIKPLEYDYEIIRGDGRILKQTKLKMDENDIVDKINEIVKYINKEDK